MKRRMVHICTDDVAFVDDVMQLLERLPYRGLLEFADLIQADADVIAAALDAIDESEAEAKAEAKP